MRRLFLLLPPMLLAAAILGGCDSTAWPFSASATPQPTATPTITPTPIPLAALVNGEPITLQEFEVEVLRFERAQAVLGIDLATLDSYAMRVLNGMIEERIVAQAAADAGFSVLDDQVEALVIGIRNARGGEEQYQAWLKENIYTEDAFRTALRRQLLVQAISESVAAKVPTEVEQVHARHILVGTEEFARQLLDLLAQGSDFASLALGYSQDLSTRAGGGDLGWFARGMLTVPEVEDAAFGLEAGQVSAIIGSRFGFHIVQTLERQESRPLTASALETLRRRAVADWRAARVAAAEIIILAPQAQ